MSKLRLSWFWLVAASIACSPPPSSPPPAADAEPADVVELLFVQNAAGVEFADGTMTLTGVSPTTLYFSDRPHRIAGYVDLESFLYTVSQEQMFRDSPPNAVLVMLEGEVIEDVVMVLKSRPELDGDRLIFPIELLEGNPPAAATGVSLFIDSAGEPDVWQTPGTVPRDYQQPATMADNSDQPGTIGSDYRQPGTVGSDQSPSQGVGAYEFNADYSRRGRYDPRGPYDTRGRFDTRERKP